MDSTGFCDSVPLYSLAFYILDEVRNPGQVIIVKVVNLRFLVLSNI